MRSSRYWTRGWKLQELIAPWKVEFYDSSWNLIGTKEKMGVLLEDITGIGHHCLSNRIDLIYFSIACKMSWAAARETTRIEDIAYCLLGLFNINMSLLYGGGQRAFRRLQEEIIKESDDQTIFYMAALLEGWGCCYYHSNYGLGVGILAEHPRVFIDSGHFVPYLQTSGPYNITDRGFLITLPVIHLTSAMAIALLNCCYGPRDLSQGPRASCDAANTHWRRQRSLRKRWHGGLTHGLRRRGTDYRTRGDSSDTPS